MLISELVDDIQRDYPEPLDRTVDRAVRRAFLDFCKRSEAWRHTEYGTLAPGDVFNPVSLPENTYVLATDWCKVTTESGNEIQLTPVEYRKISLEAQGTPSVFCVEDGELLISPTGAAGEYELTAKLAPKRTCGEIPEELADRYYEVIRNGAIYQLLRMPGQIWSREITRYEIADMGDAFERGIAEAKREARKDRSRPSRVAKAGGYEVGIRRRPRGLY